MSSYNTFFLDHPLPTVTAPIQDKPPTRPLKVGFLGMAVIDKGIAEFLKIARLLDQEDIEFHCVGHKGNGIDHLDLSPLTTLPGKTKIPQEEFVTRLLDLDCIVQPLTGAYAYYSSGTVLDAVAYEKPLFCTPNPLLQTLEDSGKPIGFMGKTVEDIAAALKRFANGDITSQIETWRANQKALREARSLPSLAAKYRRYIETNDAD